MAKGRLTRAELRQQGYTRSLKSFIVVLMGKMW
jgi:hypothetical protein